jgi:hypothetical protein
MKTNHPIATLAAAFALLAASLAFTGCQTTGGGGAQVITEAQVPPAVLAGFQKHKPGARAHKWEIENGDYIPWYRENGHEYNGLYSRTGAWLGTEEVIPWEQTPQAVKDAFARSPLAGGTITETEETSTPAHPRLYELNVTKDGRKYEIIFTPDGRQVKLVKE